VYGLPDDVFETFVPSVQQVTAEDVRVAAVTRLDPMRLVTVVVGDAQYRDRLGESGVAVETVSPEL